MSYLSQPTTTLDFGVVQVGNNINVANGVISLAQSLDSNANVVFNSVTVLTGDLTANGNLVITSVTPSAGTGISLSNVITGGNAASFQITNTGVLSLVAGPGISLSGNNGVVTVSANVADLINVLGTNVSYTATSTDEYIGVRSANATTITLPVGIPGRVYYIKDEYGQGGGKITIKPQNGDLIDGKTSYIISVPYQSVNIVFRAGVWWII